MNVETTNVVVFLSIKNLKHKIYNAFYFNQCLCLFS